MSSWWVLNLVLAPGDRIPTSSPVVSLEMGICGTMRSEGWTTRRSEMHEVGEVGGEGLIIHSPVSSGMAGLRMTMMKNRVQQMPTHVSLNFFSSSSSTCSPTHTCTCTMYT